jgi:hypothetical protein
MVSFICNHPIYFFCSTSVLTLSATALGRPLTVAAPLLSMRASDNVKKLGNLPRALIL